jgi:hypothetical protein
MAEVTRGDRVWLNAQCWQSDLDGSGAETGKSQSINHDAKLNN